MQKVADEGGECVEVLNPGGGSSLVVRDPEIINDLLEYVDYIATID